ncbi:MAG: hypothetical protein IJX96_03975 [Clostridia bacterium]|nr:hypothetical protein [Clostridia bacterium]
MEQENALQNETPTKENDNQGVVISEREAEEYRAYKRRKKQNEVASAIAVSEGTLLEGADIQRVCDRAIRLGQSAVKVPLSKLEKAATYLSGSKVKLDCVVGGTGETLAKVKAFETRLAVRRKASEITVIVAPSLIDGCRYGEIRKELKRLRRAAGKATLKVRVEEAALPVLGRVAKLASELGIQYFSIPYFHGCERLRIDLMNGCRLEVSGVESTEEFKKLRAAGVGRIVTDRAWEIYSEWLLEVNSEQTQKQEEKTSV